MNNKTLWSVVAVILIVGAFWGGTQYKAPQVSPPVPAVPAAPSGGPAGANSSKTVTMIPAIIGQVTTTSAAGFTMKAQDGSTKIIVVASSTQILTVVAAGEVGKGFTSLTVGSLVAVLGTPNSDGSVTAQSVQIAPNEPKGTPVSGTAPVPAK